MTSAVIIRTLFKLFALGVATKLSDAVDSLLVGGLLGGMGLGKGENCFLGHLASTIQVCFQVVWNHQHAIKCDAFCHI